MREGDRYKINLMGCFVCGEKGDKENIVTGAYLQDMKLSLN